jgi:spermidine synthase
LGEKSGNPLLDKRTVIRMEDVAKVLQAEPQGFDAIMLDVDNGAEALTTSGNARLYSDDGIRLTIEALRPRGRIVYWSAQADRGFERSLRRAGLTVESVPVRAHAKSGGHHTLLTASRV